MQRSAACDVMQHQPSDCSMLAQWYEVKLCKRQHVIVRPRTECLEGQTTAKAQPCYPTRVQYNHAAGDPEHTFLLGSSSHTYLCLHSCYYSAPICQLLFCVALHLFASMELDTLVCNHSSCTGRSACAVKPQVSSSRFVSVQSAKSEGWRHRLSRRPTAFQRGSIDWSVLRMCQAGVQLVHLAS